ncbi:MAG: nitrile hydratase accessory protein [Alphaproteobacteria bacterium]|nr:nitrile hydratase accessory protein [Alphaproteobacteria bacterium]
MPSELANPKPFREPWEAQAFAMVVGLHEKGLFNWTEWAESLSRQLHQPGTAVDGSDYYECWVRALEDLLRERAVAADADIGELQKSWQRAAEATPHGSPIVLDNDPQRSGC